MTFLKAYTHGRGSRVHRQGRVGPGLHAPRGTCHRPPELSPVTRLIPGRGLHPGHSPARGPTVAPLHRGLSQASKRLGKAAPGHLLCPPLPPRPPPSDAVSESPHPFPAQVRALGPGTPVCPLPPSSVRPAVPSPQSLSAQDLCPQGSALGPKGQHTATVSGGQLPSSSPLLLHGKALKGDEDGGPRSPQTQLARPQPTGAQAVRALCTTHVGPRCSHLPHQLNGPPAPPSPRPRTS